MGFDLLLLSSVQRVDLITELQKSFKVLYIGDSFTDVPAMIVADCSASPRGSFPAARRNSKIRLKSRGGEGALAELIFLTQPGTKGLAHDF